MATSRNFLNFPFPNVDATTYGFENSNSNPVVFNIKTDVDTLCKSYQFLREQLISFLYPYLKFLIQSYIGVGRITTTNLREIVAYFGADLSLPASVSGARYIHKNKRVFPREDLFMK